MSPQVSPEAREEAIRLLTALAAAKDADALAAARQAVLDAGLPFGQDPIGSPCPAEDPAAGYGLTLGCPSTKDWGSEVRRHVDGHGPLRLTARIQHCTRVARDGWVRS